MACSSSRAHQCSCKSVLQAGSAPVPFAMNSATSAAPRRSAMRDSENASPARYGNTCLRVAFSGGGGNGGGAVVAAARAGSAVALRLLVCLLQPVLSRSLAGCAFTPPNITVMMRGARWTCKRRLNQVGRCRSDACGRVLPRRALASPSTRLCYAHVRTGLYNRTQPVSLGWSGHYSCQQTRRNATDCQRLGSPAHGHAGPVQTFIYT